MSVVSIACHNSDQDQATRRHHGSKARSAPANPGRGLDGTARTLGWGQCPSFLCPVLGHPFQAFLIGLLPVAYGLLEASPEVKRLPVGS